MLKLKWAKATTIEMSGVLVRTNCVKGPKKIKIIIAPTKFMIVLDNAAFLAVRPILIDAKSAVPVVPKFAPRTIGIEFSGRISPC